VCVHLLCLRRRGWRGVVWLRRAVRIKPHRHCGYIRTSHSHHTQRSNDFHWFGPSISTKLVLNAVLQSVACIAVDTETTTSHTRRQGGAVLGRLSGLHEFLPASRESCQQTRKRRMPQTWEARTTQISLSPFRSFRSSEKMVCRLRPNYDLDLP